MLLSLCIRVLSGTLVLCETLDEIKSISVFHRCQQQKYQKTGQMQNHKEKRGRKYPPVSKVVKVETQQDQSAPSWYLA